MGGCSPGLTLVNDVSHPRVHLVQEQSIAAGRLQAMDVVTAINGTRVSSDREALGLIAAAQCEVRFSVRRGVRPPQLGGQGSRGGLSAETAERAASPSSRRMSFLESAAQRSADERDTALRTALETARREAVRRLRHETAMVRVGEDDLQYFEGCGPWDCARFEESMEHTYTAGRAPA